MTKTYHTLADYEKAISLKPDYPAVFLAKGTLEVETGKDKDAKLKRILNAFEQGTGNSLTGNSEGVSRN